MSARSVTRIICCFVALPAMSVGQENRHGRAPSAPGAWYHISHVVENDIGRIVGSAEPCQIATF